MAGTLTVALIDAHRAPEKRGAWGRGARPARIALKPDHLVLEGEAAALTLQLFEALGRERAACELILVSGEDDALRRIRGGAELLALERMATLNGATFSRIGNGPGHQVYAARFGAPGRVVVGTDRRIAAAGALGALALVANPVEAAAILAGSPLELPWPEVSPVRLLGRSPAWVAGDDVMLELKRRLRPDAALRSVLECRVIEAEALPFEARAAIAARAHELGALAVLFHSDESTRAFLQAQGREADWKPLAGEPENGAVALEMDFSDLEPLVARDGEVVRLKELNDAPVGAVWVGPETPLRDLERFRRILAGRALSPGLECVVTPGSRQVHETAARDGLLAALARAGIQMRIEPESAPRPRPDRGLSLACGVPLARGRDGWQLAGVAACGVAATAGRIADPRMMAEEPTPGGDETYVLNDSLLVRPPPAESQESRAERVASPRVLSAAIEGPLRGTVLLAVGDHVDMGRILPWGARVQPFALRIDDLASFAFAPLDATFAGRARAEGGGFVVAGRDLGGGERREQAALVLVALGIRVVLARSFAPEFRRQLRQHGVLALRFGTEADAEAIGAGDELEIPDLPEGLEQGKPLVVRNLTRGTPCTAHHDLDEPGARELREGGMLAGLRRRRGA